MEMVGGIVGVGGMVGVGGIDSGVGGIGGE
jgi:hypothetical protein